MKVSPLTQAAWAAWTPKSVQALRTYSLQKFGKDLLAGVTVGLVGLPLAMAFAISSGVPPQSGIYCAILAGFLISALGGSMTQIGGPTGAFVVVVADIVQKHGVDGLFMTTLLAGVMLVLLGVTGLGSAVKYIPRPVVIGFTNGIAILIASTQIKDFFGLKLDRVPSEFGERMVKLAEHIRTIDPQTTLLSTGALVVILLCMRFVKRVPGAIAALFLGTSAAWVFHLPVQTVQSKFGGIPGGLPTFQAPSFRADLILTLLGPALTVTMLGAIESLLSAVVSDRMSGDKHNPNVELVAQGVANIVSPLFGGLPATGAIARTATNIRSGAVSPVSGMIHAITLLVVVLVASNIAGQIPLAVLSAILFVVAYNMGEWREIPEILRLGKADIAVWLITLLLTVFADLTIAVQAGMILAALTYIRKVTLTTTVAKVTPEYVEAGRPHSLQENPLPDGAVVYRIHGPFLFGSTDKLAVIEEDLPNLPPVVILRLRNMNAIDGTGLHSIEQLSDKLKTSGRHLLVCGMREQPAQLLSQAEFHRHLGDENICADLPAAIRRAKMLLQQSSLKSSPASQ